jgi:hypothetical protein
MRSYSSAAGIVGELLLECIRWRWHGEGFGQGFIWPVMN